MNKSEQLIACLEGEIAKRDARIAELEARYQRDVYGLNNEGDPIGGDPAGGYANDNARLRAELAAIKAQEPVAHDTKGSRKALGAMNAKLKAKIGRLERELAAPAAKPQVVIPELDREGFEDEYSGEYGTPVSVLRLLRDGENYIEKPQHSDRLNSSWWMWKVALSRLNAAPVQQVSVPASAFASRAITHYEAALLAAFPSGSSGEVFNQWNEARRVLAAAPAAPAADAGIVDMYRHLQKVTPYRFKKIQDASITDGGDVMYFHKDRFDAALLADMATHSAKGVV